jgi:hypothetical protein
VARRQLFEPARCASHETYRGYGLGACTDLSDAHWCCDYRADSSWDESQSSVISFAKQTSISGCACSMGVSNDRAVFPLDAYSSYFCLGLGDFVSTKA